MIRSDDDTTPAKAGTKQACSLTEKPSAPTSETLSERIVESLNSGQMDSNHRPDSLPATTK